MSSRMRSSGQRLTAPALTRRLEQADPAANTAEQLAVLDERARADLTAALAVPRDDPAEGPTPVPCPAPRRSLRSHRALAVSAAACAVAVATAGVVAAPFVFGESSTRVSAAQISTYGTSAADAGAVVEMPSAFNAVVSNGPGSWERLAAESDLVAVGRFDRLQEGRTNNVAGETAWVSTVVVLDDVRTVQGELPEGFDGHLYVELPLLAGFTDLLMWQQNALPAGTPVLVYLRHAWDGSDEPGQPPFSNRLVDPAQGRPAGQALYEAYYPSSFIVQADDDVIVWPAMRSSSPGTLADVLPDGAHAWPDWNRQAQR